MSTIHQGLARRQVHGQQHARDRGAEVVQACRARWQRAQQRPLEEQAAGDHGTRARAGRAGRRTTSPTSRPGSQREQHVAHDARDSRSPCTCGELLMTSSGSGFGSGFAGAAADAAGGGEAAGCPPSRRSSLMLPLPPPRGLGRALPSRERLQLRLAPPEVLHQRAEGRTDVGATAALDAVARPGSRPVPRSGCRSASTPMALGTRPIGQASTQAPQRMQGSARNWPSRAAAQAENRRSCP